MGSRTRRLLAAALLAGGLALVPGASGAQAEGAYACTATGTLDRQSYDIGPSGPVFWSVSAEGTCTDGLHQFAVHISGGQGGYFPPFHPDYACGTTERTTENPGYISIRILGSDPAGNVLDTAQYWDFDAGRAFAVYSVGYTPHAYPKDVIGAGLGSNRIFFQCPGDPTAKFQFTFHA
jgi:hypothetical protein